MQATWLVVFLMVGGAPLWAVGPRLELTSAAAQPELSISAPAAPGSVSGLHSEAHCDPLRPGVGVVELAWRGALEGEQRVDLSKFPEGFATGRYERSDPLAPTLEAAAVERLEPGVNYYWRVLRAKDGGWLASATARFEAPTCPVDPVRGEHQ
jgi:hypothetical protein